MLVGIGDSSMAYRPEEATPDPANHVKGFPESYFERLEIALGLGKPRCQALDLGTGRGEVARGLARHGATVTAIDSDVALLEAARGVIIGREEAVGAGRGRWEAEASLGISGDA